MTNEFTPDYLNIDYNTYVARFKELLAQSDVYRDFDFEGSNISLILEMMAYYGDVNTYFINKVAKNVYMETADIYECVNRLARQTGYEPKGVRGSRATLTVVVSGSEISDGDVLSVRNWKQVNSGRSTEDGDSIKFATTAIQSVTVSGSSVTIQVPVRQGIVTRIDGYTGDDLIDNELLLPTDYAYDDDLDDYLPTIEVTVNDAVDPWERVSNFYTNLIPPINDNVYMFVYDRYQRNKIQFSSSRNVPVSTDIIDVILLDSFGPDGNISADTSADTWTIEDTGFIENETTGLPVSNDLITLSMSAASIGGDDAETITEIKLNSQQALRAQFRNVTENDYNSNLSARSDIVRATAWGEQEYAPSGSIELYNVVNISVIPEIWGTATITTSADTLTTDWATSGSILHPLVYSSAWEQELLLYLRPRKMISAYEIFVIPDLVYFTFNIGIRIKRLASFIDVKTDVLNKLIYYFRAENQEFYSEMDFNDVVEYLLDPTQVSTDDDFPNVSEIRNLNLRDINSNKFIYEPNDIGNYPYWTEEASTVSLMDNMLRVIQLGLNQFPILSDDTVRIYQEE